MDDSYGTAADRKDKFPPYYGTRENPIRDSYPPYPNIEYGPYPGTVTTNGAIKVWVPSFNKRTNHHLGGLVKCGLNLLRVPQLVDSDDDPDPQYLWPSPDGYGACFYIRSDA